VAHNSGVRAGGAGDYHLDGGFVRYIYVSKKGGKPMNIGVNQAKRIARHADRRDQVTVLKTLGTGLPRQHEHHQQLAASRHRYYHDSHEEFLRGQQSAA
jgi:hypothetical protein